MHFLIVLDSVQAKIFQFFKFLLIRAVNTSLMIILNFILTCCILA